MAVIKFQPATPADKLEQASFRNQNTFTYQDKAGKVFDNWQDFIWSQLRANASAAKRAK